MLDLTADPRPSRRSAVQQRYEYRVVEVREGLIGGKMSGDKVEKVLNEHARQGWQLKTLTSVTVKGRIGPGGTDACLAPSMRPLADAPARTPARTYPTARG
jgi:hypothetical protein